MDSERLEVFTLENTKEILFYVEQCGYVQQGEEHHPEGNVLNHLIQTFQCACRETNDLDIILAALLHDVGKAVNKLGHDKIACDLLKNYVSIKTLFLIEHHMRIWEYLEGSMKKLSKCKFLATHPWLPELIQLARFDKRGRKPKQVIYDKEDIIKKLNLASENHFGVPSGFIDVSEVMEDTNIYLQKLEIGGRMKNE